MPLLMPRRSKFRKSHRGKRRGVAQRGNTLSFGQYGLQSLGTGWITAEQIEAARIAINRHIRRQGQLWIRIFPHKPISKKPAETRMGKGKGDTYHWVFVVKPGHILFELSPIQRELARSAMRLAAYKLPIKVRFVEKLENDKD